MLIMLALLAGCESAADRLTREGNALARAGRMNDALATYEKAFAENPASAALAVLVGNAHRAVGHDAEAATWWRKALALDGRSLSALTGLASDAVWQGDAGAALTLIDTARSQGQASEALRLVEASAWLARGAPNDAEAALKNCDAVLAVQPDSAEARYLRGSALLMLGRYADAQRAFDALVTSNRESPLGPYGLARLAAAQNRATDALLYLRAAREAAPGAWVAAKVSADPAFAFVKTQPAFRDLLGATR